MQRIRNLHIGQLYTVALYLLTNIDWNKLDTKWTTTDVHQDASFSGGN